MNQIRQIHAQHVKGKQQYYETDMAYFESQISQISMGISCHRAFDSYTCCSFIYTKHKHL